MMYGLRWNEVNRNDQIVTKEKDFKTEMGRAKFIAKLVEKDNFIEIVAYSDPWQAEAPTPVTTTTATATATKTSGVFKVVTDCNPDFCYVGASSQIEIAFKDYMNWVTKGKAPKAIQEEADRHDRNPEIFKFEVLEEMEGNRAELNKRKKEWTERLANN